MPAEDPLSTFGANEWLVDEMYEQYQKDPKSVDPAWWDFFKTYKTLERRPTDVRGWLEVDDAWRIITASMDAGARPSELQPGTWR